MFVKQSAVADEDINKLIDIFIAERLQGFRKEYVYDS